MTDEDFRRLLALQKSPKPAPKRRRGGGGLGALVVVLMLALFVRHEQGVEAVVASPVAEVPSPSPSVIVLNPITVEADSGTFHTEDVVQRIRGLEHGEVVGRLTVPRLGMHSYPIRFGIGLDILAVGPALYPGSAAPGEGNFAMAGHRITPVGPWSHGPFRYVDTLRRGDAARVLYKGKHYRYEFLRTIIIDPDNTSILKDGRADMTFTACHPPGYATQRIVAQWRLVNG